VAAWAAPDVAAAVWVAPDVAAAVWVAPDAEVVSDAVGALGVVVAVPGEVAALGVAAAVVRA
jgi:hypothetical protein